MAKPASGTGLDTGNALYTNLAHVWGLLEGSGTSSADSRGTKTLTLSDAGLWATNGSGENIIRIAAATANPLALATALGLVTNTAWSIAFRAKQANSDDLGMLLGDNTGTSDFIWLRGGNYFRFRSTLSADFDFTGLTTFTTTANYVLTCNPTPDPNQLILYKDGSAIATLNPATDQSDINITTLGNGYTSNTFALVGDIEYVYVWTGRVLDSTEVSSLHSDPYQIFDAGGGAVPLAPPPIRRRRFFR